MTDPALQMYLMASMLIATAILFLWGRWRMRTKQRSSVALAGMAYYKRMQRISKAFLVIFLAFGAMVIVYVAAPGFYFVFLPLDTFHHPLINTIGMLIIKLAIVWIIAAQLHIDKEVFKYYRDIKDLTALELVWYSESLLMTGMLALFIGIFFTITNVIGFILTGLSLVFFFKNRIYKYD